MVKKFRQGEVAGNRVYSRSQNFKVRHAVLKGNNLFNLIPLYHSES